MESQFEKINNSLNQSLKQFYDSIRGLNDKIRSGEYNFENVSLWVWDLCFFILSIVYCFKGKQFFRLEKSHTCRIPEQFDVFCAFEIEWS
jgi:hypothetical protein